MQFCKANTQGPPRRQHGVSISVTNDDRREACGPGLRFVPSRRRMGLPNTMDHRSMAGRGPCNRSRTVRSCLFWIKLPHADAATTVRRRRPVRSPRRRRIMSIQRLGKRAFARWSINRRSCVEVPKGWPPSRANHPRERSCRSAAKSIVARSRCCTKGCRFYYHR
jgi:hypothetical protein